MIREYRFYSEFKRKEESIIEFAEKLTNAFSNFSKYDDRFRYLEAHLPKENKIIDLFQEDSYIELANAILEYNKKDIRKFDKVKEPNIYYKRPFGFSFGFNFRDSLKNNIFSLRVKYGGIDTEFKYQMNETPIKQLELFNINWYLEFIKALIDYLPIQYAVVRPRDTNYLENAVVKFKYPIGLLTYLSNETIDFETLRTERYTYEIMAQGILIFTSKDLFESNEELESLYNFMNNIGVINQDYLI